jgi:RNA polymerase sigma factor (sigma-70 family)
MHGPSPQGLQAVFLANRDTLRRFLIARGVGDASDDVLQELWLKLDGAAGGPVGSPMAYLFRAAENLMRDRHRSERQARLREKEWTEASGPAETGVSDMPSGERVLIARQELAIIQTLLNGFQPRAQAAFRLHRIDSLPQRDIAQRLGVSLSTIEKDLRDVYQALLTVRGSKNAV